MSEGFGLDWLRLREPHDLRARSRALARQFGAAVRARAGNETASVVDLGAGSGANFRVLAPLISGDQDRVVPRCYDDVLLHGLPNAGRVVLEGCGHVPSYTHPEVLAEVIRQFLTPPRE